MKMIFSIIICLLVWLGSNVFLGVAAYCVTFILLDIHEELVLIKKSHKKDTP